jgi:Holliday junction resolvase RusA-like endonuclease
VRVEAVFDYPELETRITVTELPPAPKYRTNVPDVDNLAKQVLEALEESGVVRNDAQVTLLIAEKV